MINLTKGESVSLTKGSRMSVRITWPAKTDYDVGAEILYKDQTTESIATFGARGIKSLLISRNGTVKHLGDVTRGVGQGEERILIEPDDEIEQITPWVYSAQSNGTGSFYRYAVTMEVFAGDDYVKIDAQNASDNDRIYTCIPGIITFGDGVLLQAVEHYSAPGSELRPTYAKSGVLARSRRLIMEGPRNHYK